ncbi:SDR family oxidoreductase [Streptomyces sp. NPDC001714]|uniref:SDR family oxidoreductase n=1 Tax=Streptomyces sp. NPDC001714 TaxID=3364603 RepID=UPI00367B7FA0
MNTCPGGRPRKHSLGAAPKQVARLSPDPPEVREPMSQLSAFKRLGEPQEVADVAVFLATNRARWITGASLDATGSSLLG